MNWIPKIHFEISERKVLLRLFDVVFIFSMLALVSGLFDFDYFYLSTTRWTWALLLLLYYFIFAAIFELYDLQKAASFQSTLKSGVLAISSTVLFFILTPFFSPVLPENRLQIVFFFMAMVSGLLIWRYAYISLISAPRFNKRILLVGNSFDINLIAQNLHKADPNYRVIGFVNTDNIKASGFDRRLKSIEVGELIKSIRRYSVSEIVVSSTSKGVSVELYNQLIKLLEEGFPIREYTQVYEEITHRVPVQHVERDFYKYFPFSRSNKNRFYLFISGFFNAFFAIVVLVLTLVLLPLILLGNLIANPGPLIYRQKRVGMNGKVFEILKFRTMVIDAEADGAQYAKKKDRRITPFGKILRNTRLDEIPQCINILKGDMSLIGPRPERPVFVKKLSEEIPFYEIRHVVKPGLTGWAQVRGRYAESVDDTLEKLQYDLYYIKHRSFFLDLNILLKTISTVIYYRGQ
ncbi:MULTISPECIES: exopolysaccharide biosynthesis polyprenyl glycosylphosphotransferase [unclassified Leeuwenhoekiella]|uniref:exopolysaccharide biosynthesis polyprenyl glycosylphosphotransferase n=1 Tax=unclassified Leeuwenhoekiella TaxID=2615029 RepID=UPI000C60EEF0|nr:MULTISPECIES: exopolysaccharide biosynthesis polyprenyl glycosylphosphotransferase [unclassified Leeuwenhoekiella]MAW96682.1 sugar transferase [Leeuwenhoekiella sp.]MBA81571.1 sugar transferase [Leeuwenhoekiella sp.]|tara:strand:- start:80526 stop:81914 length:1389 start_codon:yes stop_codon:yes gene_type:complete